MTLTLRAGSLALLTALLPLAWAQAQNPPQDANPVDTRGILEALSKITQSQTANSKALKMRAYQEAIAAASNPARATELWEEAVRAMQFQGLARESTQFHDWKAGEGESMKEKEVQSALHLYFNWLALTLQRSAGSTNRELFNAVLAHAQQAAADQAMMDVFNENLKKEKEATKPAFVGGGKARPNEHDKKERSSDEATKKLHDQILGSSVSGGLYAQAVKITDLLSDIAPPKRGRGQGGNDSSEGGWESSPGNVDGMWQQILIPEMRTRRDLRVIEYWDAKLRRETDIASRAKLAAEVEKFNTERRPQILWSRAREFAYLSLKNRAATEMFGVVKAFPSHPDAASWIQELTTLLAPPAATPVVVAEPLPGSAPTATP